MVNTGEIVRIKLLGYKIAKLLFKVISQTVSDRLLTGKPNNKCLPM